MILPKNRRPIFIDIDGCLTTGKNNSIPWRYVKELQTAFKKYQSYYEYIIVSARPASYAEAVFQFLGLMDTKKHKYAICESGTVLHLFGSDKFFTSAETDYETLNNFEKKLLCLQKTHHFKIEDGRKRTICVLANENQDLVELSNLLKKNLPNNIDMHVSAGGIDFMPYNTNKATAVTKLAQKLDLNLNHAISIGDSGSDIPLMMISGHPACPKNANDKVKEVVRNKKGYIAKKIFSLGVVEILEKYYYKSGIKLS